MFLTKIIIRNQSARCQHPTSSSPIERTKPLNLATIGMRNATIESSATPRQDPQMAFIPAPVLPTHPHHPTKPSRNYIHPFNCTHRTSTSSTTPTPRFQTADLQTFLTSTSPTTRFIPLHNLNFPPTPTHPLSPTIWTPLETSIHINSTPLIAFLTNTPTPHYAIDISSTPPPTPPVPLRTFSNLPDQTFHLLSHAHSLLSWHARTVFCAACGHNTHPTKQGTARLCPNPSCATRNIYPRVMPSVLALVQRRSGQEVLLGRKKAWPKGRYSVLAGFAEIFETLEQAVVREVYEETGVVVEVGSVRYCESQPWASQPFASLMSGFSAVGDGEVCVCEELEHAKWFERDELRAFLKGGGSVPGKRSLGGRMIFKWLEEG